MHRRSKLHRSWAGAIFLPLLMFCLVVLFANARLNAQAIGGYTGTVTDSTGAVIPGARVVLKNIATGIVMQVATSTAGIYTATITPGDYSLTATAPGFQTFIQTHVVAEVGVSQTLNIHMKIGAGSETVQVISNAIALNTTEPQLDTMLSPEEVTDLPLEISNTIRQISSFATLAPGVRTGSYGSVTVQGGAPSQINSAGTYYNGLQLDTSSAVNSNPPYEMVDEFRILRSTFSAKYGLVQGAVSYNMRSGTNALHGDVFLIDRNSVFDSDGFFPTAFNANGTPKPPADQEVNYGGTVGGPVILPKLYNGKNRTFFLISFDEYSKSSAVSTIGTVPTAAEKTGDFSNFLNASGVQIPIYDPLTGQPFPGNVIPASRIDPLSASILPLIPNPNATGTTYGQDSNMNPVIASVPLITHAWGFTLNHAINSSQNISFTWWRNFFSTVLEEDAPIVPASNPLTGQEGGLDLSDVWLFNYEKTLSPNLVVTAGAAVEQKTQNYNNSFKGSNFAGVTNDSSFPVVTFNGENAPTDFGVNNGAHVQNAVDNIGYNFVNNWLWTKGRHTFNFGGEFHHFYQNTLSNYSAGQFNFSQAETSTPNSSDPNFSKYGSAFASFLLGGVDSASRNAPTVVAYNTVDLSAYAQDDIKLNRKLTVNLGLRWDVMRPYEMSQNNNVFINETAPNPAANNLPGAATEFGSCTACAGYNRLATPWKNVGPHVGFSYAVTPKTVLQGGYSITYLGFDSAYGQGEGLSAPVNMSQLLAGQYTQGGTGSSVPGFGNWSTGPNAPMPSITPKPFSPSLGVGSTITYLDPNNGRAPMYQAWSMNLQRQLPWNMFVSVAYSGNRVTHLTGYNINPISQPNPAVLQLGSLLTDNITSPAAVAAGFTSPYPGFAAQFGSAATVLQSLKPFPQYSSVSRAFDQAGTTFYNALQIQGEKRTSSGLSYMANLTLPVQYDNLATPLNRYNPAPEWATDADTWEVKVATTYALPIGIGQRWLNAGWMGRTLGGWKVAGILTYNNAGPLQITQSGTGLNGNDRPNVVPGVRMASGGYAASKRYFEGKGTLPLMFTTNAFANTGSQFVLGDANRAYSALRGPKYPAENLSAQKLIPIKKSSQLTLRMDYFNALNRAQSPYPSTNISSSNFGEITGKSGGGNRQGQISATLSF